MLNKKKFLLLEKKSKKSFFEYFKNRLITNILQKLFYLIKNRFDQPLKYLGKDPEFRA